MGILNRMKALDAVAERTAAKPMEPCAADISSYGEDVFDEEAMREYLPKDTCAKLLATIIQTLSGLMVIGVLLLLVFGQER